MRTSPWQESDVKRGQVMRLVTAGFGGVVVAVAFLAGLLVINSRSGFTGSAAATAAGWTIPLLAGVVAGVVAWVLLLEEAPEDKHEAMPMAQCRECGRALADEWRLCPYCGTFAQVDDGGESYARAQASESPR
jgi:hypothetical protein